MCGINGVYSKDEISLLEKRILNMNKSIKHRGPDSSGKIILENKIALGHQRLSIIDVSSNGNQPMNSTSNKYHIVFNGEIYNFNEIKQKLDYNFQSNTDTEVILAAIENYGIDWFLDKANGMFSIAIFNSKSKSLHLIRDRLGIKPLFYFMNDNFIVFSSEIKGILSSGLVEAEFNEEAVDEYLANRYVREPFTFFKNIFQVSAGTYVKIDSDLSSKTYTYWDIPDTFNQSKKFNEKLIKDEFEQELIKSINYRLISDVPLGTYLSGGVDSSLITSITSLNTNKKINTYTIGFKDLNEFVFSNQVAKKYNTNHHTIEISKNDYVENWKSLIAYKDAPLGVPNEIPLALMSTELRKKITVVLSGEGADELLGGYGKIFRSPYDYQNSNNDISFYKFFNNKYEYVCREFRDKYLATPINYRKYFDEKICNVMHNFTNEHKVFYFFHKYHVKGLLQRVDTTTMQTSVEARVPFLDHNLIEFSYSKIPYDLKLKWKSAKSSYMAAKHTSEFYSEELDIPKYLLKEISYKYLPKEIIERKKVGFPVPLTKWFGDLETIAKDILSNSSWLKREKIDMLIHESKSLNRSGQILWMFINIEYFKNIYFNKKWKW